MGLLGHSEAAKAGVVGASAVLWRDWFREWCEILFGCAEAVSQMVGRSRSAKLFSQLLEFLVVGGAGFGQVVGVLEDSLVYEGVFVALD